MHCAKIGCGGRFPVKRSVPVPSDHNPQSRSMFPARYRKRNPRRISASMLEIAWRNAEIEKQRATGDGDDNHRAVEAAREKIDRWMSESVTEIVKNLHKAPLLVQVHAGSGGQGAMVTTTEKAEEWEKVKGKWERGEAEMPEGMIFVEQINGGDGDGGEDETTRAWGLVVQAKGMECGPVCYLLKTTRVAAGPGIGIWATRFCLVKVCNFIETAETQLENCWLFGKSNEGAVVRCGIDIDFTDSLVHRSNNMTPI